MPEFPDVREWKASRIACEPVQRMQDPWAFYNNEEKEKKKKTNKINPES